MSRQPSDLRKKARQIWLRSKRKKKPKEIAEQIGVNPSLVRKWKSLDRWDDIPETRKLGAPIGNKNALGNRGGPGGPEKNDHAVKHGLFRRFLPDDEVTREIFDEAAEMSPLDILVGMIQIKVTNILRSQEIMFVRDREDQTKVLKKTKKQIEVFEDKDKQGNITRESIPTYVEEEYDIQHAWDKQGNALKSQAAAMRELRSLMKQYEEMLRQADPSEISEKRKAEMELLKSQVRVMQSKEW